MRLLKEVLSVKPWEHAIWIVAMLLIIIIGYELQNDTSIVVLLLLYLRALWNMVF